MTTLKIHNKNLPHNIILIYTTILDEKYVILNDELTDYQKNKLVEACEWHYENNSPNHIVKRGVFTSLDIKAFNSIKNKHCV